ncbi:pentapeptide repeat-containing protein [Maribellus maritimus]|uniref:pentapeptide repeat-containing protein n=1 Tax=Maribellus maritimus TaxID=2870838 RepID=UPI001EEA0550|nr:pentapeptide repeat-containing protein [Maribellus maritimus]MCG6186679.1 pentapeptide repeat-containing protein [Maribellus maritimus]
MKLFSKIKKDIYSSKAKKIQEEIDLIKQRKNSDTCELLCSKLFHFSKLDVKAPLDLRNCFLENAKLNNIILSRICFWSSNLKKANFTNAYLYQVDFWKADLSETNFANAELKSCVLAQTNLQNSILTGANLKNARMENANLTNADFTEANLKWARIDLYQLKSVKSLKNTIMPDGTEFSSSWQKLIESSEIPETQNYI